MAQDKARSALEPFLALTKSATSPRAAVDLVTQATSHPNTYVFAELLETPQIQNLSQSPDHAPYLKLLEIFSYGTYATYSASATGLPPLNDAQTLKLRQLSLLTLAQDPRNVTYAALQEKLGLPDTRAVEDLVISAIYAGLIDAQLDPRNRTVHIFSISPLRDLSPGSIPRLLNTLREWSDRCTPTLQGLESEIELIKQAAQKRHATEKARAALQAKLIDEERNSINNNLPRPPRQGMFLGKALSGMRSQRFIGKRGSGSLDTGADDDELMDIDEEEQQQPGDDGDGGGTATKKRANRRKM
ncbi:PCI domain-containing protein [Xylaria sp. CBS 124048]|nr:PCI domain-containing protein [Xylaria sp. CBS 124048]